AGVAKLREYTRRRHRAGRIRDHRRGDRLARDVDHGAPAAGRQVSDTVDHVELADVDLLVVTFHRRGIGVGRHLLLDDLLRGRGGGLLLPAAPHGKRRDAHGDDVNTNACHWLVPPWDSPAWRLLHDDVGQLVVDAPAATLV